MNHFYWENLKVDRRCRTQTQTQTQIMHFLFTFTFPTNLDKIKCDPVTTSVFHRLINNLVATNFCA